MQAMKKFIRYLYEYQNGRRVQSAGFVKAEESGSSAVLQIYGKGFPAAGRSMEILLFYLMGDQVVGISMGMVTSSRPMFGYRLEYTPEDVGGEEIFRAIEGVIILSCVAGMEMEHRRISERAPIGTGQGCRWYAATWNDSTAEIEKMLRREEILRREEMAGREESVGREEMPGREESAVREETSGREERLSREETSHREEMPGREESIGWEETSGREERLSREEISHREEVPSRNESTDWEETSHREEVPSRKESAVREETSHREEMPGRKESVGWEETSGREEMPGRKESAVREEISRRAEERMTGKDTVVTENEETGAEGERTKERIIGGEVKEESPAQTGDKKEHLPENNDTNAAPASMQSAAESEPAGETVFKITRRDLAKLPRREWKLANNQFLMHGYRNYHHLISFKKDGYFWLGVPGIYHPREQQAASAFGFGQFMRPDIQEVKLTEEERSKREEFGYWCRVVSALIQS